MSSINIRNGILLVSNNNYLLYEMYMPDNDTYFMCIPSDNYSEYQIMLDLPEVDVHKLSKEEAINEMMIMTDKVYDKFKNIIYVLPNIDVEEKKDALRDNDNHLFTKFHNKVMNFVTNAYWSIKDKNNEIIIPQTTNIIIQTDMDKRYIDWLQIYKSNENFIPIDFTENLEIGNAGGPTLMENSENNTVNNELAKPLTKKLLPPKKNSGYSNVIYLTILLLSIIISTIISYLLLT